MIHPLRFFATRLTLLYSKPKAIRYTIFIIRTVRIKISKKKINFRTILRMELPNFKQNKGSIKEITAGTQKYPQWKNLRPKLSKNENSQASKKFIGSYKKECISDVIFNY